MMVGLHGAGEAAAEESDGCRGVSRTAGSLLALGNSMTIIDTGLPGFASGQVSEGATVTPEAHSEVVDQILGRTAAVSDIADSWHRRLTRASRQGLGFGRILALATGDVSRERERPVDSGSQVLRIGAPRKDTLLM